MTSHSSVEAASSDGYHRSTRLDRITTRGLSGGHHTGEARFDHHQVMSPATAPFDAQRRCAFSLAMSMEVGATSAATVNIVASLARTKYPSV